MSGLVNDIAISSSRHNQEFASGTKMVFNQTSSPTGWTKVTGIDDDQALRVTTGTVGTGGDVAFETAFADKTFTPTISRPTATSGAVTAHTLAVDELPGHTHSEAGGTSRYWFYTGPGTGFAAGSAGAVNYAGGATDVGTGGGGTHTHAFTQPTISIPTSNAVPIDINVKFVDVIIATKD